jgi:hypothetical protein
VRPLGSYEKVITLCKCLTVKRSDSQLWKDFLDEVVEILENPFDKKEWSDSLKGLEDLVERYLGVRVFLGSGINRVHQRLRLESHGCIRSWRKVKEKGGCLSE